MTDHPRAGLTLIERCPEHAGAQVSACLQCEVDALRRERDELRALLMDARGRVVLLSRVTTHYPGCAQHHPDCALIARIDAAMAWEVRDE